MLGRVPRRGGTPRLGIASLQARLSGGTARPRSAIKAELITRYGAAGRRTAERMLRGQLTDAVFGMPLNEDVLDRGRGLIGHSRFILDRAQHAARNCQ